MSSESNHLAIYLVVGLNTLCQVMLIWRLKLAQREKLKFSALSVAIPVVVTMAMRLLVAVGALHLRVAEQVGIEKFVTVAASILLIAGPPMATAAAVLSRRKVAAVPPGGDLITAQLK